MLQCGRRIIGDWDRDCLLHVSDYHCERPMFDCRSCGARYKHESTMMRHRKKCEGCYNISCYICGKCFYRKDHCTSHLVHKHKIEATFHWWYREKAKDKAGSRYAGHFWVASFAPTPLTLFPSSSRRHLQRFGASVSSLLRLPVWGPSGDPINRISPCVYSWRKITCAR